MKPIRTLVAALAAATLAFPAAAILIRPDRDDEEYRELATRYPSTLPLGAQGGTGVLVAPRWILTTASLAGASGQQGAPLRIAGRVHAVQQAYLHPEWRPGGEADVALILLREPVLDIEPTPVYRDSDEQGRAVRLVGYGQTGRIGAKPDGNPDRRARAAINTIDAVEPRRLVLRIKPPDEASDLQGAAAPGDEGAPAFLEVAGRILVGGLLAGSEDANGDGLRGSIGDRERLVRVSAFAAWVDEVTGRLAAEEAAAAVGEATGR